MCRPLVLFSVSLCVVPLMQQRKRKMGQDCAATSISSILMAAESDTLDADLSLVVSQSVSQSEWSGWRLSGCRLVKVEEVIRDINQTEIIYLRPQIEIEFVRLSHLVPEMINLNYQLEFLFKFVCLTNTTNFATKTTSSRKAHCHSFTASLFTAQSLELEVSHTQSS